MQLMVFMCTGGLPGKESACSEGDLGSVPGLGGSPGEGNGYPLQYSVLETSTDRSPQGHKELDMTEQLSFTHLCGKYWGFDIFTVLVLLEMLLIPTIITRVLRSVWG